MSKGGRRRESSGSEGGACTEDGDLSRYMETLRSLPEELNRNFARMRALDRKAHHLHLQIDEEASHILTELRRLSEETKRERLATITSHFSRVDAFQNDKVRLSNQSYELVDRHIRRLDEDLANLARRRGPRREERRSRKKKDEKVAKPLIRPERQAPAPLEPPTAAPTDVLDMPVDPNEPTYCLCHQVSYGEMIGCDNPDCPIEWFHFACVDLREKPEGNWYCPRCDTGKRRRK